LVQANSKVFEESDGAVVFRGENYGLHTRVFVNSLGLPTYEAKELGLVEAKKQKEDTEISLTVTANETNDYFKVVRKAAELIFPDLEGKMLVRFHGMMRFAEGKMSSRKGNVITGESLLIDLKEAAKEKMQGRELPNTDKVAEQVAVGAIKYAVLKQGSGKDIVFDPAQSLSIEGDSGPYVQYAHTRALSLTREAEKQGIEPQVSDAPATAHTLERLLLHFPDTLERAAKELEPHYITTYVTELASAFNSWYASERIIGGTNPHYGVLLALAVEQTLAKGLHALGIPAPERM
jgi:arginyl-tRNA synthetase